MQVLSTDQINLDADAVYPLRWGKLALNGVAPFTRALHSTVAALRLAEAAEVVDVNVAQARSKAGQAPPQWWRAEREGG